MGIFDSIGDLRALVDSCTDEQLADMFGEAGLGEVMDLTRQAEREVVQNGLEYYRPQPYQRKFHESRAKMRLVLGGNRSGKTICSVWEACAYAMGRNRYKPDQYIPVPNDGWICSVSYDQMKETVQPYLLRFLPNSAIRKINYRRNTQIESIFLTNGSRIWLKSYDQERERIQGSSIYWVLFDEEPPESFMDEARMRLLDQSGFCWVSCTPLKGVTYLFHRYFIPEDPDIERFQFLTRENALIPQAEMDRLLSTFSDEERLCRESGVFLGMNGLVYPFLAREGAYCDPFPIPPEWQLVRVVDPSGTGVTACLWMGIDEDDCVWVYREYYQGGAVVGEHARVIREMSGKERYRMTLIDPASRARNPETGRTMYDLYLKHLGGAEALVPANNDVSGGIATVNEYLQNQQVYRETGAAPGPRLTVFRSLRHFRSESRTYLYERYSSGANRGGMKPKPKSQRSSRDHLMDCLRYGLHYGLVYGRPRTAPRCRKYVDPVTGY